MNVLILGSGLAGLLAAIEASATHEVTLVTKGALAESNTAHAQGGVAVVGLPPDTTEAHAADTVRAGAGLSDPDLARVLAADGPTAIDRLLELGTRFDRTDGALCRAMEAAHSAPRVLRAGGDATGAEIVRALSLALAQRRVTVREHTTALDLIVEGGHAVGMRVCNRDGEVENLRAHAVVLATGGAGQLYPITTNPAVATADGVAIALRAGAQIADAEMVQFHPTVLATPDPFLISEAVRGDGAVLLDADGHRFMTALHTGAELAPRDVVARAIAAQALAQGSPVMLDATAIPDLAERFPTIVAACAQRGLDLAAAPIPVSPAAHYWMGGVRTDSAGATSIPGLWAIGEVACTGVHGANRLASNSLLEAAVFARRCVSALPTPTTAPLTGGWASPVPVDLGDAPGALPATRADIQAVMWRHAGLLRTAEGLESARAALAAMRTEPGEDANLLLAARAVVAAALGRAGSLGAHQRIDAPEPGPRAATHRVLTAARLPIPVPPETLAVAR